MGKFILRSKAVLQVLKISQTGSHRSSGQKDSGSSSWDFQRDKDYADWPLYDYGEKMIMSSFLDAHTHLFPEPLMAADMCVRIWEKDVLRRNV